VYVISVAVNELIIKEDKDYFKCGFLHVVEVEFNLTSFSG